MGLIAGFGGSIPVAGPASIMIFSLATAGRIRSAIQLSLGTALAEGGYAFLAFIGFGALLAEYGFLIPVSRGLGAILLTGLGLRFAIHPPYQHHEPSSRPAKKNKRFRGKSFMLGFSITALNPTLIATWTAAMALVHSMYHIEYNLLGAFAFAFGVTGGIAIWFIAFVKILQRYRKRFSERFLKTLLRFIGVILIGFGIWFALAFVSYFKS